MKYSYTNYYKNPKQDNAMSQVADTLFPEGMCETAFEKITSWPDYKQTDLIELDDFAKQMGVAKIYYKESCKNLGGEWRHSASCGWQL